MQGEDYARIRWGSISRQVEQRRNVEIITMIWKKILTSISSGNNYEKKKINIDLYNIFFIFDYNIHGYF